MLGGGTQGRTCDRSRRLDLHGASHLTGWVRVPPVTRRNELKSTTTDTCFSLVVHEGVRYTEEARAESGSRGQTGPRGCAPPIPIHREGPVARGPPSRGRAQEEPGGPSGSMKRGHQASFGREKGTCQLVSEKARRALRGQSFPGNIRGGKAEFHGE